MTGRTTRVLLVAPPGDVRTKTVASLPWSVSTAPDAASALDELDDETDCVVATETVDGGPLSLLKSIREQRPTLPFFLLTEDGDEALASRAVAAGVDGYVPASAGPEVLRERVADVVEPTSGPTVDSELDRLRLVYEQAPLAVVEVDADGHITAWNAGAADIFGYEPAAAIGEHAVELLVPPDEREAVRAVSEAALSPDGDVPGVNVNRNVTADGEELTCEWYNRTLTDDDGTVLGALSFVRDVTDRVDRRETVESLQAMTSELVGVEEPAHVADFVVEAARTVLDQPYAGVFFHDETREVLRPVSVTGEVADHFEEPTLLDPSDGVAWRAFREHETVVINEDATSKSGMLGTLALESAIVVPLGDHGILAFGSRSRSAFDRTDVHMANILASTTQAALDRSTRERDLERHQTIVEAAGDGVFALDESGRFRAVNDVMAGMTGYEREDLLGRHVDEVLPDEQVERGREELAALSDGETRTFELEIGEEEEVVEYEATIAGLPAETTFDGTAVVVRDISERKRMEAELVAQKRKIEALHAIASDLDDCETREEIWTLTVEAAERVLDFDICCVDEVVDDFLVSRALSSEVEPKGYSDRVPVTQGLAGKTHRTGRSFLIDDVTADNAAEPQDRTYRSLLSVPVGDEGVFQAVSDEVGAFDQSDLELTELLMTHVADALERASFETELKEERDRFAALFQNVPDPVVYAVHDENSSPQVVEVNAAFEQVFGYDADEIVGGNLDEFIVPPDREDESEHVNERANHGELVEGEVKRRTTDGLRDFLMTVVPVDLDEASRRTFGVYTDITERKERQKRVEILNRVLRHDLRNGMNIIKGSAEMLGGVVDGTTAVGYSETIIDRADDLIGLAEKTRAVERTLDRDRTATGPVNVREGVSTSIARLSEQYPAAEFTTDLPESAQVRADDLLRTAIFHVIENAVEHNDTDEPEIHVSASRSETDPDVLQVSVADNGPGIPEPERALLAEEQEITQLRHASGLGLWLVNWVVTQAGGRLSFEDNEPRGTVVTLHVPLAMSSVADERETDGRESNGTTLAE
ncbi:PAS domain S-box protein [Haloarchaeobius iranensis]|uniref:histidine kinase n=1 Tax=Haloarchaeobius iranensis TaxID=996166 RepID=A0A1H0AYJ9_9EURY|nr:PAS domain S-box protein [Haloarchaeobius iranensis]SDN38469.1 PAS domain S-box-containing protein [Haloarchaeobius iranensis]